MKMLGISKYFSLIKLSFAFGLGFNLDDSNRFTSVLLPVCAWRWSTSNAALGKPEPERTDESLHVHNPVEKSAVVGVFKNIRGGNQRLGFRVLSTAQWAAFWKHSPIWPMNTHRLKKGKNKFSSSLVSTLEIFASFQNLPKIVSGFDQHRKFRNQLN